MSGVGWHFKKRERSDEATNPIQGEFFDEAGDPDECRRGPAASVVREAIQNSLDAHQPEDEPVHVRIFLSEDDKLQAERARTRRTAAHTPRQGLLTPHSARRRGPISPSGP